LERQWNGAMETSRKRSLSEQMSALPEEDWWRLPITIGESRRSTVTPEVAGSSPVAPVSKAAASGFFVFGSAWPARSLISRLASPLASGRPPTERLGMGQRADSR
jgi:predicted TIM-barrel fold metal-dependent hydrolase